MRIVRDWLHTLNLLKLLVAAVALIAAIGSTAMAASSLGLAAKKKCNQTCQETKLFDSLYKAKIASAHVAFATAATNAANANSAGTANSANSAATASAITGTISGSQVSSEVATAASAMTATNATNAVDVDGHTFTQINASAGSDDTATLLNNFGGLTLQCIGQPGTAGTVTLQIVNSSAAAGTFGAGEVDEAGTTKSDEGITAPAVGSTPTVTNFPFPIDTAAQVSFSFKELVNNETSVVSGMFTIVQDNGCSAFGNADGSSVAK